MIELSLDNETLDILPTACVLTVGGVLFQGREILETAYFAVELQPQIDAGRTLSASTIRWWLDQGDAARRSLLAPAEIKISTGRAILRDMGSKAERIWARPGMFDLPMLRHLFGQDLWDDPQPRWKHHGYQKEADLGTLVKEFDPHGEFRPKFEGTAHDALDDAKHHHVWLMNIREGVQKRMAGTQPSWPVDMLVPETPPMPASMRLASKDLPDDGIPF